MSSHRVHRLKPVPPRNYLAVSSKEMLVLEENLS